MKGTEAATRWQGVQDRAGNIKDVLDYLFSKAQEKAITQRMTEHSVYVKDLLQWTGAKGVLVAVVMQSDVGQQMPPTYLSSEVVGAGGCPYDVLVAASLKPSDKLYPSPAQGSRVDEDASFFFWATKQSDNLKWTVLAPGSRGPLLDRAKADADLKRLLADKQPVDEANRLLALAAETRRRAVDDEVKKLTAQAAKDLKDVAAQRAAIQQELNSALHAADAAKGATAWIEKAQLMVSIGSLAAQVNAMLKPTAPASTLNAVNSASDVKGLNDAVTTYLSEVTKKVEFKQGQLKTVVETYEKVKVTITGEAQKAGAPPGALP
ncbi:hypothetical protein [Ramlibacter alkalitolerans]|uniref:Lipoprotein n=1 Tax=Ramlibacter alkalitolerans TaxID=2039631 RepID=A0ABS1JUA7_9BURK|nr:hypothetical protein [Ramlibacter alkalitolerans]MBL0427797.1 hypothetical protein [Ramlibacter alkalitolerans]